MDRGVRSRRAACLTALAAASLGLAVPQAAGASARGFSQTPSKTEAYAACGRPARGHAACLAVLVPGVPVRRPSATPRPSVSPSFSGTGVGGGYAPADLRSAYNLPSASAGSGQTVAIVDAFDDPNAESDLATYRSRYGLAACTTANGCFKKVDQSGGSTYPKANAGWAVEISLDLDMASAACPNCHILLVEASDNADENLYAAENEAATLGATEISNSWGGEESSGETSSDSFFNHPGVPITVSAGDSGYGVEYPAASPYVIAVGGTKLTQAANSRGWSETAWSGTGSGCSAFEPKPAWQTDAGCPRRTNTDVSAVASPQTPVSVADSYKLPAEFSKPEPGWTLVAGTSVSSPLVAGIMALSNAYTRSFPGADALYRQAAQNGSGVLDDVVSGSNGSCGSYLCNAVPGYDGPTGLGSPSGAPLVRLPNWYRNGVLTTAGAKVPTLGWGRVTLSSSGGVLSCKTATAGNVWNPEGGGPGQGDTQAFATYECAQSSCPFEPRVTAEGLPWKSALYESALDPLATVRSKVTGIRLLIGCYFPNPYPPEESNKGLPASPPTLFGGPGTPGEGEWTPMARLGTSGCNKPAQFIFGAGSGELEEAASKTKLKVSGAISSCGFEASELISARI